jgi:hypothetical protein
MACGICAAKAKKIQAQRAAMAAAAAAKAQQAAQPPVQQPVPAAQPEGNLQ